MLIVSLFGGFSLQYAGAPLALPSHVSRCLLAFCAAHRDQAHTRSRLAGLFWPDLPEATARRRLSHALWEIGQTLPQVQGATYLTREAGAIGFNRQLPHAIDLADFEQAWRQAQKSDNRPAARPHLEQAAALYTGDFLAGFYDDWVLVEQERLRERYLQVLQQLIAAEKATGDYDAALRAALALIAADPLREAAYREAIRLCQQLGRPQEARQLYEQCRAVLQTELGVAPEPETVAALTHSAVVTSAASSLALVFSGEDLPLVGRGQERQALLRCLDETQRGRGGVALLAGEAGVGKSRLLRALAEDAAWRSMTVLWGQAEDLAPAYEHSAPYAPLLAALADGLSPLRAQQLATLLDRLWISVAGQLLPQLAAWLPGVSPLPPMQPAQERIRLLEGIVRLILALGAIAPALLILEDLHWADEATFDALAYLAQRLPDSRVLLVASFRPIDAQERPPVWAGLQAVDRVGVRQRIALEPLTVEQTGDLVQRGLGLAEPAALFTARLHARTGGNPLFVLESLRTLHAEGLLVRNEASEWTTPYDQQTADYAELPLSPVVDQTIARRLARIDAAERNALAAAAVLGGEISLPLLAQVSEQSGRDLLTSLGGLIRHNLLHETATAYRFSHDKVRETVLRELEEGERRTLHLRAGAALAADKRAAPAAVAYHFAAGEDWTQAARFYWRAGQEAAELHSYRLALAHLDRVEVFCRHAQETLIDPFALLARREEVLARLGERARQQTTLAELERMAKEDDSRSLTVHQRYGRFLNDVGDHGAALTRLEAALSLAQARQDTHAEASILALMGQTLYRRGELQAALPVLRQAIRLAQAIDAPDMEAEAQTTVTGILNDLSDHEGATNAGQRAIALYRRVQNPVGEADVLATLGAVAMEQGRLDDADAYFAQALPMIQGSGYRYAEARCLVNWGAIDYLRGRLGSALERFRLGAAIFQQVGSERGIHFTNLNIAATVSTYVGQDEGAEALTQQALTAFAEQANTSAQAQALGILAQFAYLRRDFAQALALYDESLRSVEASADPWVQAQARQARATVHLAQAAWREALQDAKAGLVLCTEFGFNDLSPLFWALQSQALLGLDRLDEAQSMAQRAAAGRKDTDYGAHLIHFYHHRALERCGDHTGALAAIQRAHDALKRILDALAPADQARSRREIPEHRAIMAAWEAYQPMQLTVRLPRIDAPLGRPLTADEEVAVRWTVETAADRAIRAKNERRRHQILRLLHEAQSQGAAPAYHHLAEALQVSERTILRDMAALSATGTDLPPTRGA